MDCRSRTASAAVNRTVAEHQGGALCLETLHRGWMESRQRWFRSLCLDKYHYLGDKELMHAAFLLDLGLFFFGLVRDMAACARSGFAKFPYTGPEGAAGRYGESNLRGRIMPKGFEPDSESFALISRGVGVWLGAELRSAFLPRVKEVSLTAS